MKTLDEIIQECNLSFEEIQIKYKNIYDEVFQKESHWLTNIEEKTSMLKDNRPEIENVIRKLKDPIAEFVSSDLPALRKFISGIDKIVNVNNWINNFKEGKDLKDGTKLSLVREFNEIKKTNRLKDFKLSYDKNLKNFVDHVFSIIKHCQNPDLYPVYYPFWRNILGNVLLKENDYDSLCIFYRTIDKPRSLNLGAYFGTIGTLLAKKITENKIIKKKNDKMFKKVSNSLLNIHYFDLITGYDSLSADNEDEYKKWLNSSRVGKSQKPNSYLKAIKILSDILGKKIFETNDKIYLRNLYDDLIKEQTDPNGRFFHADAPSYGTSRFYSASIESYINFLDAVINGIATDNEATENMTTVKNKLAQAICIVGESGVGKSFRVKKTLVNDGHKALFVIVDNMWQHILVDYSPNTKEYTLTKVGKFIEAASKDLENHYTIVFDECHKNLEIINDVLLQAISTKRNNGIRFLSLNSLIDEKFSFLSEDNGHRILPDNLGFIFISSKTDLIEGNDDLRSRIEIVKLFDVDQEDNNHTIDFLIRKTKKKSDSDFTN